MPYIILLLSILLVGDVSCATNPNDLKILNDMRNGLENPELLKWGEDDDPCGSRWPHVYCSQDRVTQIQVQSLGLKGPLPQNLNQLDKLYNVGFQRNNFTGKLPSFSGLSDLQYAYLDFNGFDSIPSDFFNGLASIRVLALDSNPFNQWSLPRELGDATQLVNFSCSKCNIIGRIPNFFGKMGSLGSLRIAMNELTGEIPSSFRGSMLQTLWLNDQAGGGLTGSIDVIASMVGLTEVWLHGNRFVGSIPENIGELTSLRRLRLNRNRLVGLIPPGLAALNLESLDLSGNILMGPIPKFKASDVKWDFNSFCGSNPGKKCAAQVNALLEFLRCVGYPERLASQWTGNDPCNGPWWGITCDPTGHVSVVNLPNLGLNGNLSPSLGQLPSLLDIHLQSNDLRGRVPESLTQLESLRLLNINGNDFDPPLPKFRSSVKVAALNNPKLAVPEKRDRSPSWARVLPPQPASPKVSPELPRDRYGPRDARPPMIYPPTSSDEKGSVSDPPIVSVHDEPKPHNDSKNIGRQIIIWASIGYAVLIIVTVIFALFICRKTKGAKRTSSGVAICPNDSLDHDHTVKISIIDASSFEGRDGNSPQTIGPSNLAISLHALRRVTNDFSPENQLGRGGFGTVYKGELEDRTKLAVKRMESGSIGNKALDEFRAEIAVLSKVRHRNLVSLLGYSVEGNERLLVYEYMPRGALSRNLFRWRSLSLEPLSWTKRLVIALDVARGVEYLHTLAHQSFIHRDLKSSNILLDDDFRAKVSDFGLVKLAPDRGRSVATRLAGTFGYLAPEYAVTGKITTKVDVYSFGVVLMELLTGLTALDEQRPEEKRYLAEWFWHIKSRKETLISSIDPSLDTKEYIYESIYSVAELAGHCTARDPSHRPEMGHIVSVLSRLVDTWKPHEEANGSSGVNLMLPLSLMLKGWKEEADSSGTSEGSIPIKPSGFADSFTSVDAR